MSVTKWIFFVRQTQNDNSLERSQMFFIKTHLIMLKETAKFLSIIALLSEPLLIYMIIDLPVRIAVKIMQSVKREFFIFKLISVKKLMITMR